MSAIGNIPSAIIAPPPVAVPTVQAAVPQSGNSNQGTPSDSDNATVDTQVLAARRAQAVQMKAENIANTHVLGDTEFAIFKDQSGQLITRFRNKVDGKVTYIPQPSLFTLGGSSTAEAASSFKIKV
jgi:hypothetical protein